VVPGGGAVSYERGTPAVLSDALVRATPALHLRMLRGRASLQERNCWLFSNSRADAVGIDVGLAPTEGLTVGLGA